MKVKQFKDAPLAHYSYALISDGKMAIIDPARNPLPYYKYAEAQGAKIIAVFLTHLHADFISGHLQIHKETGAKVYISQEADAKYPHQAVSDGFSEKIGKATVKAIDTPGHSLDSVTYHVYEAHDHVIFSGDTLFVGDVGRPDLREKNEERSKSEALAKKMYHSIQKKYKDLPDHTIVYPAHGAGSLCGKNMSDADSSTLGNERKSNWAFEKQNEAEFVKKIVEDQPFIPVYFEYNVELNKAGAKSMQANTCRIPMELLADNTPENHLVIDTRDEAQFKKYHLRSSINIMGRHEKDPFETWLGSVIKPNEKFYVVIESVADKDTILERISKIGYETSVVKIMTISKSAKKKSDTFQLNKFKGNEGDYNIVDVRNQSEVEEGKIFKKALAIPLHTLRENLESIPTEKPIVVHCAGGYRSAIGSSILKAELKNVTVYDLSEDVNDFKG